MYIEEIKRCLRGEINKRENEQYFTCQTNVRQMCKDVLAKLEEQESVIAELKDNRDTAEKLLNKALDCVSNGKNHMMSLARKKNHADYKRCLANAEMAKQISMRYYFMFCLDSHDGIVSGCTSYRSARKRDFWDKWEIKWLELADKFKEAK